MHKLKLTVEPFLNFLNQFISGILYFFRSPWGIMFSENSENISSHTKFLAIKNFSVNEMMSGQPNKITP